MIGGTVCNLTSRKWFIFRSASTQNQFCYQLLDLRDTTGARGWIYSENPVTTEARQIAITQVDKKSPADGILAVPVNTSATVCLPCAPGAEKVVFADAKPAAPLRNRMTFTVGSGRSVAEIPLTEFWESGNLGK